MRVRAVVYADAGGRPGSLAGVSGQVTLAAGQPAGWVEFPFASPPTIATGQQVWLGYWYGDSGVTQYYDQGDPGSGRYVAAPYSPSGSPPSSFGTGTSTRLVNSLYAVLSAGEPPVSNPSAPPTISGLPFVGQTLSATSGDFAGTPPFDYAYSWLRCDGSGSNCAPTGGATGQTYVVQAADEGFRIAVEVTATNPLGSSEPSRSAPTAAVRAGRSPGGRLRPGDGRQRVRRRWERVHRRLRPVHPRLALSGRTG